MKLKIATWNINSVRLRMPLVLKLLEMEQPDILCLQECKSPVSDIPTDALRSIGYDYLVARGQKGYNGVATISKIPIEDAGSIDFAGLGQARHVAVRLENGVIVHNHYIPAGGDIPDREQNMKFGQKLDYLKDLKVTFESNIPKKSILVGDLNIAPYEDDVWSHKQLLKVVSHTPVEVETLLDVQKSGNWVDVVRQFIPNGKLYSWWSYRAKDWQKADKGRRLDHVWATRDIAPFIEECYVVKEVRGWDRPSDHVPVLAIFDF